MTFAAGVMMAASYWSLLAPSIEIAEESGRPGCWPALCGMLAGVGVVWILDKPLLHLHPGMRLEDAFWYGQLSAIVEPVTAVMGAVAVTIAAPLLPYALSFAAGAMIYVVVEELIPESHQSGNVDLATLSFVGGFTVMMVLDVALG